MVKKFPSLMKIINPQNQEDQWNSNIKKLKKKKGTNSNKKQIVQYWWEGEKIIRKQLEEESQVTEAWRYFKLHVRKVPKGDTWSFLQFFHWAAFFSLWYSVLRILALISHVCQLHLPYSSNQQGCTLVSYPSTIV